MSRADKLYLPITVFLVVAAVVGATMLAEKHSKNQPMEIVLSQPTVAQLSAEVYIEGAVSNPGAYSLKAGDTVQALLLDAGVEPDANLSGIKIFIPRQGEEQPVQKVDLNRAESWLLQALPGIGEGRAQAIVDYRNENGPFERIEDVLSVTGIGEGTFEKIKDYITVSD